jgi:hypothetical protein
VSESVNADASVDASVSVSSRGRLLPERPEREWFKGRGCERRKDDDNGNEMVMMRVTKRNSIAG